MLSQLFQSVFSQSTMSVSSWGLVLSLLTSMILGLGLAYIYRYRTDYSRDFAMMLVVLPTLIAVIIFLVNGNLGTSVAVAGAFSLIRFRSPASSSKELLFVFMATAVGLATGVGYLFLALWLTLLVGGVMIALERVRFSSKKTDWQELTIGLPQGSDHKVLLNQFVAELGTDVFLEKVKVKQEYLEVTYRLMLPWSDDTWLERLSIVDSSWIVNFSRTTKKKKSL
ncbi:MULTISPECIES: DUF4956 domain-containing protein [Streptococcus]|uniref:DUF4956 domain-containing protein n=1 Tax=Streptococcus TaxID=1301 RepID=UPI00132EB96B|nr:MULTISPECIES: DUF4956 domain-containing protein [Streptococcus]QHF55619.1 hypothetical protein BZG42_09880 [Streptococcus sp. DAT741]